MRSAELGFWWRSLGGPAPAREPLREGLEVDVAIVGAGYTGLWSAYYLKRAAPQLQIAVLERDVAGYGASGRNGGWVSGFFAGAPRRYEARRAAGAGRRCNGRCSPPSMRWARSCVSTAWRPTTSRAASSAWRSAAPRRRASASWWPRPAPGARRGGPARALSGGAGRAGAGAGRTRATFTPHVARIHPAKLLRGLAGVVESLGVPIYEHTPVLHIAPHEAAHARGSGPRAMGGAGDRGLHRIAGGQRRALAPVNSSMIVTEPLPAEAWSQIGWSGQELMADEAHVFVYLQRTADGRIAIGGRGVPYRFGSRTDGDGRDRGAHRGRADGKLAAMFPPAARGPISHRLVGSARRGARLVRDGGGRPPAAGSPGRAATWAKASRPRTSPGARCATCCSARTARSRGLPWVGRRRPRWEPEPLRWAGIRGAYALYRLADREERRSGRPSRGGGGARRASPDAPDQ